MEKLTIEDTLNELASAYASLEVAKEECKDVVESTLAAYFGEIETNDKKAAKAIKASRRTESKNIKKLAKAMLKGEKQVAKEEADNMTSLIESLG
jgi:hypothetical protein